MKRFLSVVLLSSIFTTAYAQKNFSSMLQIEKNSSLPVQSDVKTLNNEKQFVFKVYSENLKPMGEIEPHFMGKEIAEKWTIVNELYLRKTDVNIGFGSSFTETFKPSILNAVYTMNSYYKKALKRKAISENEARKQFIWILDCAIGICHCLDSKDFEMALAKAKDASQIVYLFNSVRIESN